MTGLTFQNTRRVHRRHNIKREPQTGGPSATVGPIGGQPSQSNNPPPNSPAPPPPSQTPKPPPQQPPPKSDPNQGQNQNTPNPPNQNQNTPDPNQNQSQSQPSSPPASSNTPSSTQVQSTAAPPSSTALPTSIGPIANTPTGAILNSRTGLILPGTTGNTLNPSFATGASIAPTATPSATPSGALSTGAIVGLAAGGLVAFGVLVSVSMWIIRRYFQGRHNDEDDDEPYLRNSVHVEDEPDYYNQPRPPTMIERHFGSAGVGAHGAVSFNPGDIAPPVPAVNPFMTPVASPSISHQDMNHGYEQQQQQYVVRNGSIGSKYSQEDPAQDMHNEAPQHPEHDPQPHIEGYANLERGSVTPFQAQQYAEIQRQLSQNNGQYAEHNDSSAPVLPEIARALSPDNNSGAGYNYPVPGHGTPTLSPRSQNFSMPSSSPRQQQQLNGAQLVSIPENAYSGNESAVQYGFHHQQQGNRPMTMYDEEDAYGGM